MLARLEVEHFGHFRQACWEFKPGLNLICGPNEAGKTTLLDAIYVGLFSTKAKERYRPWGHQGHSLIRMEFYLPQHRLSLQRQLPQDQVQVVVHDQQQQPVASFKGKAAFGGRSSETLAYQQLLATWLGCGEQELFRVGCYWRDLSQILAAKGGLQQRILKLLSGSLEQDYPAVQEALQTEYFELTRRNPWGRDKTKDRPLEELEQRLQQLTQLWQQYRHSEKRYRQLQQQLTELGDSLAADRRQARQAEAFLDRRRRQLGREAQAQGLRQGYQWLEQRQQQLEEVIRRQEQLRQQQQQLGLPQSMPEALPRLLEEAQELQQRSRQVQQRWQQAKQQEPTPLTWGLWWLTLVGGCGAGIAVAMGLTALPWWHGALAGLVPVLTWGGWRLWHYRQRRRQWHHRFKAADQQRQALKQEQQQLQQQFADAGAPTSPVTWVQLAQKLPRYREIEAELWRLQGSREALEQGQMPEAHQVTEQLQELETPEAAADNQEPDHGQQPEGPAAELEAVEAKLAELRQSIERREAAYLQCQQEAVALEPQVQQLEAVEEEGELLQRQQQRYEQRSQALQLAVDWLQQAMDSYQHNHRQRFVAQIGNYMAVITDNRYCQVSLDEDMAPQLLLDSGDSVPLSQLSQGTLDALYTAVRLSVAGLLAGQQLQLPLLVDDSLLHLDDQRRHSFAALLARLGREQQVLWATHDQGLAASLEPQAAQCLYVAAGSGQAPAQPACPQAQTG